MKGGLEDKGNKNTRWVRLCKVLNGADHSVGTIRAPSILKGACALGRLFLGSHD